MHEKKSPKKSDEKKQTSDYIKPEDILRAIAAYKKQSDKNAKGPKKMSFSVARPDMSIRASIKKSHVNLQKKQDKK